MQVEWIILADYAEIISNKLYLSGGGWDRLTVAKEFPASRRIGIAASFIVPWNETNQKHEFEIQIVNDDGQELSKMAGGTEVGRPAGHPPGLEQRIQIAGNLTLEIKEPGTYHIIGKVHGQEDRRVHFVVVPSTQVAIQREGKPPGGQA